MSERQVALEWTWQEIGKDKASRRNDFSVFNDKSAVKCKPRVLHSIDPSQEQGLDPILIRSNSCMNFFDSVEGVDDSEIIKSS